MRTTLSISDEVLDNARGYATRRGVSLGKAVEELIKRGLSAQCPIVVKNGIAVLSPGPQAPPLTDEDVKRVLEDSP